VSELDQWCDHVAPVRVGVVDADPVFAAQLAEVLDDDPVLVVSGTAATVEGGLELALAGVDLLLVDCRLPDSGAPRLARAVRRELSGVAVVGLSSRLDRSSRLALIAEGAAGSVDRSMPLEDLAMVVREAFGGRSLRRLAHA
jgi:DNA-binding NarL/FixJ family response regulator